MGCFDYECECGGRKCIYQGGQDGGDCDVIIEVPLNDGTVVYIKGRYESYGSVHVGKYQFYPEQFSDFFEGWLSHESDHERSKIFLAKRIWTFAYTKYNYEDDVSYQKISECCPRDIRIITKLGKNTISKFIRADDGLNIPNDEERKAKRAEELQSRIAAMQRELNAL